MMRLAIIDWGIGGISVYRRIKDAFPDIGITYFSDTGSTPYGKMERFALSKRLDNVIAFLEREKVTHLIIGCNAASTAICDLSPTTVKIEGVIKPAIRFAARSKPALLGVIGGRRTITSQIYRHGFEELNIQVKQRIAQPLSGMIESGDTSSEELNTAASRIISPLKKCSHILLACTHYPAIEPVLKKYVSDQTVFLDPSSELVRTVIRWKLKDDGESDEFFTTGDAVAMQLAAKNAFGVSIKKVKKVTI